MPSTVLVSRAIDINAPADSIKPHIADLRQWVNWVKGMNAPLVKIISAREADLGTQKVLLSSVTDTTVETQWVPLSKSSPIQISTIHLIQRPERNLTIVQWQFVQHLRWYPWEKLGSFMNDKILGPMMELNLQNLKQLSEHQTVQMDTAN